VAQQVWLIRGFDSTAVIFEKRVPGWELSDRQVSDLLRMLVARAGLTFDEIVGECVNRRSRAATGLLKVQRDGLGASFTCGENPFFSATLIDEG
jgi:hypothetical protein